MLLIQMTGLSGAGKSSLAFALKEMLDEIGLASVVIDGDQYRKTICSDLGFSANDRRENIRRLGRIADEYVQKGCISIIAAINPFEDVRNELAQMYNARTIWIKCKLEVLFQRDTKGLYTRACLPDNDPQKILNLTGVNDLFDIPVDPDMIIDTSSDSLEESKSKLMQFVLGQLTFRVV